jgi:hypothetical protein
MLLYKYLELYSNRQSLKAIKDEEYILKLMEYSKKDYTLIDEVFKKEDHRPGSKNREKLPVRIPLEKWIKTIEQNYPIAEFDSIYTEYHRSMEDKVNRSPIPLNMVHVKFLECVAFCRIKKDHDEQVKKVVGQLASGGNSGYIKFLNQAVAYIQKIQMGKLEMSAMHKLRLFFNNDFENMEAALEIKFIFFLFRMTNRKASDYFLNIKKNEEMLRYIEFTVKNAQSRLRLLSYISTAIRDVTQGELDYFDDLPVKSENLQVVLNKQEFKTAEKFDIKEIDNFPILKSYRSFVHYIDEEVRTGGGHDQIDLNSYLAIYKKTFNFFKILLTQAPNNLEINKFNTYFRNQIDTPSKITQIGKALNIPKDTIKKIIKTVLGFLLVEDFYRGFPPLKSYTEKFGLSDSENFLPQMQKFYSFLKAKQTAKTLILQNLNFQRNPSIGERVDPLAFFLQLSKVKFFDQ